VSQRHEPGQAEHSPDRDFAAANGWDRPFETYEDANLPTYVGPVSFARLPWITDPAEIRARDVDVAIVGAPFDDAVTHRSGARFGPRAIRQAQYTTGSMHSLQLGIEPFEVLTAVDAGDANIIPAWIERAHALIYRKVRDVPRRARSPSSWVATTRSPGPPRRRWRRSAVRPASASSISMPTPTPLPTIGACSPGTARRCAG